MRTRRRVRGPHATRAHAEDGAIIFFTQAEVRALLAATKQQKKLRDQAIILLAYRHGLRAGEVGASSPASRGRSGTFMPCATPRPPIC